jgi:hypothetical protein
METKRSEMEDEAMMYNTMKEALIDEVRKAIQDTTRSESSLSSNSGKELRRTGKPLPTLTETETITLLSDGVNSSVHFGAIPEDLLKRTESIQTAEEQKVSIAIQVNPPPESIGIQVSYPAEIATQTNETPIKQKTDSDEEDLEDMDDLLGTPDKDDEDDFDVDFQLDTSDEQKPTKKKSSKKKTAVKKSPQKSQPVAPTPTIIKHDACIQSSPPKEEPPQVPPASSTVHPRSRFIKLPTHPQDTEDTEQVKEPTPRKTDDQIMEQLMSVLKSGPVTSSMDSSTSFDTGSEGEEVKDIAFFSEGEVMLIPSPQKNMRVPIRMDNLRPAHLEHIANPATSESELDKEDKETKIHNKIPTTKKEDQDSDGEVAPAYP